MMSGEKKTENSTNRTIMIFVVGIVFVGIVGVVIGLFIRAGSGDGSVAPDTVPPPTVSIPTIQIVSVAPDNTVSIQANNFPTGIELEARIGPGGSDGSSGIPVGTTIADADGEVFATFPIPVDFHGQAELVIRLDGAGGYFAYHGFNNR